MGKSYAQGQPCSNPELISPGKNLFHKLMLFLLAKSLHDRIEETKRLYRNLYAFEG